MKRYIFIFLLCTIFGALQGQNPALTGAIASSGGNSSYAARSSKYQTVWNAYTTKPDVAKAMIDDDFYYSLDSLFTAESITMLYLLVPSVQYENGALINWVTPGTNNADNVSTTAWTQYEGYTGDGSADYISTNFVPSSGGVSQDDASVGIYIRNDAQANCEVYAAIGGGFYSMARIRNTSNNLVARLNAGLVDESASVTNSSGFFLNTRRASNDIEFYRNGGSIDTESDVSSGVPTGEFTILGVPGTCFTSYQFALFIVTTKVDDTQSSKLNTIIERRMDRLGKGVE